MAHNKRARARGRALNNLDSRVPLIILLACSLLLLLQLPQRRHNTRANVMLMAYYL